MKTNFSKIIFFASFLFFQNCSFEYEQISESNFENLGSSRTQGLKFRSDYIVEQESLDFELKSTFDSERRKKLLKSLEWIKSRKKNGIYSYDEVFYFAKEKILKERCYDVNPNPFQFVIHPEKDSLYEFFENSITKQSLTHSILKNKKHYSTSVEVFKNDKKNILGLSCYKVVVRRYSNAAYERFGYETIYELYVSDEIQNLPAFVFFDNYYPRVLQGALEIKKIETVLPHSYQLIQAVEFLEVDSEIEKLYRFSDLKTAQFDPFYEAIMKNMKDQLNALD